MTMVGGVSGPCPSIRPKGMITMETAAPDSSPPVGWFRIDLQLRTLAWMPFWWFNTLSWTIVDGNGYIVDYGWGRRKTAYADANAALTRAYTGDRRGPGWSSPT
jgi:hypothetical protein